VSIGAAFVFGKLPAHGDFIARGLTAEVRDTLDAWLSASLTAAQAALGDGFAERFDTALPWRFVQAGRAGALAPSADSAGRRFPVMVSIAADPQVAGDAAAHCEALLHDAIVGGWTVDALAEQAAAIAPAAGEIATDGWWHDGGEGAVLAEAYPADLLLVMLRPDEGAA
jgi:type VI secretion system ImpM family protein